MQETITVVRGDRVARLTIDRPPLNVLDLATLRHLRRRLEELESDSDLQVLVISGAGTTFSAGVAVEDHTPDKVESMLGEFHGVLLSLMRHPAVTVAAVEGHCLGGGMEMAAACDLVQATNDSRFGQPEIKLGCFPPMAAALYPRLFGSKRASDLLLTGKTISAHEAFELGLVSRLTAKEDRATDLDGLIAEITAQSRAVTRITKRALRAGQTPDFIDALSECERLYNQDLVATVDMQEGLNAFLEKRPPQWTHE